MARMIGRLTAAEVDSLPPRSTPYADGGNLYLDVQTLSARSWVFIFRWEGKQRTAGGGKAGKGGVSLKDARRWAAEGRAMLNQKPPVDPRTIWRAPAQTSVKTFGAFSNAYVDRQEGRGLLGKSAKHRAQWRSTLLSLPARFRDLPVDKIGPQQVFEALDPIWAKTPETGRRLRGRIEAVLDFARAPDDVRPNPAALSGWLKNRLGSPNNKIDRKTGERIERGHLAALPYRDIPTFAQRLRAEDGVAARCLEILLLTATRVSEARDTTWREIDFNSRTWSIPPERLKTGRKTKRAHVVPLSDRSLAIFEEMREIATSDYVFNGRFNGQSLTNITLLRLLQQRMGYAGVTIRGFRSSFRDWAGDETHFPREVCEQALGHAVGGVEGAYRRGDALEKRRKLMDAWAAYCESPPPSDETAAANVLLFESISARAV